jgi:hypothetical protein
MALGSTQPITELSTRKFPGGKGSRRVGLTTLSPSVSRMSEHVRDSTSHSPKGLHGLYRDSFTFTKYQIAFSLRHEKMKEMGTIIDIYVFTYRIHPHSAKHSVVVV